MMDKDFNFHVAKAMEEVSIKNANSIVEYSRDTREIVNSLKDEFSKINIQLEQRDNEINQLKDKILNLQMGLLSKGLLIDTND